MAGRLAPVSEVAGGIVCSPATSEAGANRPRSTANYSDSSTKMWSLKFTRLVKLIEASHVTLYYTKTLFQGSTAQFLHTQSCLNLSGTLGIHRRNLRCAIKI
jgi:hypothetical protein